MSKIKNWMCDMEEIAWAGIESGIRDEDVLVDYVRQRIIIDESYIRRMFIQWAHT